MLRKSLLLMVVCGFIATFAASVNADTRVSATKKGSLIYYSKVELKWNSTGALTQDTFITIVNDYTEDVFVQWYFVNGDAPLAAVFNGGLLVERAHRGWNWADCTTEITHNESNYMSMARGTPLGCQPFTILDPGTPQGRPDPDGPPGSRILRGFAVASPLTVTGTKSAGTTFPATWTLSTMLTGPHGNSTGSRFSATPIRLPGPRAAATTSWT
jgi:hypothetical protein